MNPDLINNKFWDNTDPNGDGAQIIRKTDLRKAFLIEFSKWAEPYCLKGTKWQAEPLGLFGTSSGMKLILKSGGIKKSLNLSISLLAKKFGDETGIPVFTNGNKVFSNKYSLAHEENMGSEDMYSTDVIDAYKELYGKPMYPKTNKIIGTLSECLKEADDNFVWVKNYNYVGSVFGETKLLIKALKQIGIDFDVIKVEGNEITIQEDDIELIKKFEYKYKDIKKNN